jgi:DNA-binding MarR family transcriptional regulator
VDPEGRLSDPAQRRLSPTNIDGLIAAYRAGATISRLAAEFGIHRTTVAGHLDRRGVPVTASRPL